MSFNYSEYKDAMRDFAIRHKVIRHDAVISGTVRRKSFFMANGEEELRQDIAGSGVNYPLMVLLQPFNRYTQDGDVNRVMTPGFEIRMKAPTQNHEDEIQDIYSQCQAIAEQILGWINLKAENCLSGSPFYAFDVTTVQGDFVGPVNDGEYGYGVRWQNKVEAWDPYAYCPEDHFEVPEGEECEEIEEPDDCEAAEWVVNEW